MSATHLITGTADAMTELESLTDSEIRELARDWFAGLNEHRAMVAMLPMLAADGFRIVFPEATLTTLPEFEAWYQGVIRTFFDQDHILQELQASIDGDHATVDLVVVWKASRWTPPAAMSERTIMRAEQSWIVKRSPQTGKAVIAGYTVRSLKPTGE
jgi:hypothetical protein